MLGAAVLAVGMAGQVQTRIGGHEGYTFVPKLGGWIGDQAEKLATEKELTAGKRLFGTYSSALEAMTGQLQPTGTDCPGGSPTPGVPANLPAGGF